MDWLGFWHYMFAPEGQPFYTGQFWPNMTQWVVVTVPSIFFAAWRLDKRARRRHEDLKQHITETYQHDNQKSISRNT